jgi:hypothetical protein
VLLVALLAIVLPVPLGSKVRSSFVPVVISVVAPDILSPVSASPLTTTLPVPFGASVILPLLLVTILSAPAPRIDESQPVPILMAADVKPAPGSVTLLILRPFSMPDTGAFVFESIDKPFCVNAPEVWVWTPVIIVKPFSAIVPPLFTVALLFVIRRAWELITALPLVVACKTPLVMSAPTTVIVVAVLTKAPPVSTDMPVLGAPEFPKSTEMPFIVPPVALTPLERSRFIPV